MDTSFQDKQSFYHYHQQLQTDSNVQNSASSKVWKLSFDYIWGGWFAALLQSVWEILSSSRKSIPSCHQFCNRQQFLANFCRHKIQLIFILYSLSLASIALREKWCQLSPGHQGFPEITTRKIKAWVATRHVSDQFSAKPRDIKVTGISRNSHNKENLGERRVNRRHVSGKPAVWCFCPDINQQSAILAQLSTGNPKHSDRRWNKWMHYQYTICMRIPENPRNCLDSK